MPLVKVADFGCKLHILILRRDEPRRVFTGSGDLDGRVKTLIDGLRMPRQPSEMEQQAPSADENPFFCLLEDDRSILEFTVETDRLLVPLDDNELESDVFAVVRVNVTTGLGKEIASAGGNFY